MNPKNATKMICMLIHIDYLIFLSDICTATILANFEDVYQKTMEGLKVADSQYWHFRMVAVVIDADNGIIITRATKLTIIKILIFEDVVDNNSCIQVEEDFGFIIVDCSKDIWKYFRSIRAELRKIQPIDSNNALVIEESVKLYNAIINAEKDPITNY